MMLELLLVGALCASAAPARPACERSYSDAKHAGLSGQRALTVTVVDEQGKPAAADVTVTLAEGSGSAKRWRCTVAAKGGTAAFANLPDRDLVVVAGDFSGRRALSASAPLGAAAVTIKLARPAGAAFLFDRAKQKCLDSGGAEGRNAGRIGECGEVSRGAFDAPYDSLSGSVWTGLDLSRRDLSGARLEAVVAKGVRLDGARLAGVHAEGASFEGGSLKGARLRGADLRGARVSGASLEGADLSDADLRGADLAKTELSNAQLSRARYDDATHLPFSIGRAYRRGMVYAGEKPPKIDEGGSDPSFRAFRESLKSAVQKKDVGVVAARLTKNLRERCGAADKFSCFEPLADALAGGGVFTDDSYSGFLAPSGALLERRAGDVFFSKTGDQWQITEISARD